MTAVLPDRSITEGVCSLEVRWIFPGPLETAVAGWFGRFPAQTEAREDRYLLDPCLPGLSVKVRAGEMLEVKVFCGSPGILDVAGRARGRMESWQKWSFPFCPLRHRDPAPAGWRPVAKRRRISRFSMADGRVVAGAPRLAGQLACAVELTEVRVRGESWWSLGLEATGPAVLLSGGLEITAALVFAQAVPGGVEFGLHDSTSYAEWLGLSPPEPFMRPVPGGLHRSRGMKSIVTRPGVAAQPEDLVDLSQQDPRRRSRIAQDGTGPARSRPERRDAAGRRSALAAVPYAADLADRHRGHHPPGRFIMTRPRCTFPSTTRRRVPMSPSRSDGRPGAPGNRKPRARR